MIYNTTDTSTYGDEAFSRWLNTVDAMITYDVRRETSLTEWRHVYEFGYAPCDVRDLIEP